MPYASALSEHPVAALATGEVVGEVLEAVGERPDLVVLTVTRPHAGALEDMAATVKSVLHPLCLIGCAAESVVGTGREVEETAAVSLWAARVGPLLPVALRARPHPDGRFDVDGWPAEVPFAPSALVVVADPYSLAAGDLLEWLADRAPGLPVVGGNASAGRRPGGNRLVVGERTVDHGAVGVLLGPGVEVDTVVSQGARPYGRTLTVTAAHHNLMGEVAGVPALESLVGQISADLAPADVATLEANGLHVGRLVDERVEVPGPGDFLVRTVIGVDRGTGALALDDQVPLGATVRFHLRDADTAHADLAALLEPRRADGALLFSCNGRGTRLFDHPHHDAAVVGERLGPVPLGGILAAGEIGPVGGTNFVHSFSASLALLRDR